jgi:cytidine deaminase
VVGDGPHPVTPCGGCRQQLREFVASGDTPIIVADRNGVRARFTMDELLPHSFGPHYLET